MNTLLSSSIEVNCPNNGEIHSNLQYSVIDPIGPFAFGFQGWNSIWRKKRSRCVFEVRPSITGLCVGIQ